MSARRTVQGIVSVGIMTLWILLAVGYAQRGGGSRSGGSFSSGGSRPSPTAPSRATPTSPSPAASGKSSSGFSSGTSRSSTTPSSTTPVKPANSTSSVDKAVAQKAAQQGTVFKDRAQAQQRFTQDRASTYRNQFDREPPSRPGWVPQSYTIVGGPSVSVTYVPWMHGYGYWNPVTSSWLAYDIAQDQAMLEMQMAQEGYLVENPYRPSAVLITMLIIIIVGLVIVGIAVAVTR